MDLLLVGALLLPAWAAAASPPHLCLAEPLMALEAGSTVASVALDGGPVGRPCKAMLSFADPNFLPLSYYFDPLPCPGRYLVSFLVPAGAPNGDAFVTWRCAGLQPLCSHARISGGSADPSLDLENAGTVGCVSESLQTGTALVTRTMSSSTLVESHRTIFTATSTSLHAAGSTHAVGSGAQTKPAGFFNRSDGLGGMQAPTSSSTPAGLMGRTTSSSASPATFTGTAVDAPATSRPRTPADDSGAARSTATAAPPFSNTLLATLATLDANTRRTEINAGAPKPTPATIPTTPTTPLSAVRPDGLFQNSVSSASRLASSVLPAVVVTLVTTLTVV